MDGEQIIEELDDTGDSRAILVHGPGLGADIGSLVKAERAGEECDGPHGSNGSVGSNEHV